MVEEEEVKSHGLEFIETILKPLIYPKEIESFSILVSDRLAIYVDVDDFINEKQVSIDIGKYGFWLSGHSKTVISMLTCKEYRRYIFAKRLEEVAKDIRAKGLKHLLS